MAKNVQEITSWEQFNALPDKVKAQFYAQKNSVGVRAKSKPKKAPATPKPTAKKK